MNKKLKTILFSPIIIGLLVGLSPAQIRTVTGSYCARTPGNKAAAFAFLVGSEVMIMELKFGGQPGTAKMARFNPKKLRIGDEFIIKFDDSDALGGQFIKVITGTGKRKTIKPCKLD